MKIYKCKNCGRPIVEFDGSWWHRPEHDTRCYGELELTLSKATIVSWDTKFCECCHQRIDDKIICKNPEPKDKEYIEKG